MKYTNTGLVLFAGMLFLSGCAVQLDADYRTFPVDETVVPIYKEDQTINVKNHYSEPEIVEFNSKLSADLKQYTDTAIKTLEQGLKHRNISIGSEGPKSVKLKVHTAKFNQSFWTMQIDVSIDAELGNGKTISTTHHTASPATAFRAASGAITRATEKILKHQDFINYMNE